MECRESIKPIFRLARLYLQNEELAHDVVQESYERLLASHDKINPRQGVKNYLFTIAANLCFDRMRRARSKPEESLNELEDNYTFQLRDSAPTPARQTVIRELEQVTAAAITALPRREKEILLLKKVAGLGYRDIGHNLGLSESYCKKLALRALERIRSKLERAGFIEDGKFVI